MPTSKRHYRIALGYAIGAHERVINEFGGRPGIQDIGRVEAAIGRTSAHNMKGKALGPNVLKAMRKLFAADLRRSGASWGIPTMFRF